MVVIIMYDLKLATDHVPLIQGRHSQGSLFSALTIPKIRNLSLSLSLTVAVVSLGSGESWQWRPGAVSLSRFWTMEAALNRFSLIRPCIG